MPVGQPLPKESKKRPRNKGNNLKREIQKSNIEYLYGGGYYTLNGITSYSDPETFYDIQILVETVSDPLHMKNLKIGEERSKSKPKIKCGVQMENIENAINGYGRITKYR